MPTLFNALNKLIANPVPGISYIESQTGQTRNKHVKAYKMKTHTGMAARFLKSNSGTFRHGPVASKHGNAGWNRTMRTRNHRGGIALGPGHGNHLKTIRRLMPYSQ
ncbi:uncharacterized protein V1516DRAFT_618049 [Lipomyces oligophaga]|uniref:uncharacterized protein n=1 Tax=Lipomyces oligophaga TaxID=45792 RepID=UPI0034CD82D0